MARRSPRQTTPAWVAGIVFVALAGACRGAGAPPETDVRIVDIFARGADASSPLVVWIHGRGGTPERFADWWRDFPAKVEVALPQGFTAVGDGWSWFEAAYGMGDAELARAVGAAEDRLWRAIAVLAHGRRVIVAGFSQGGILAYALAARHPDHITYAFPIAGGLPAMLRPRGHAPRAPVFAMHGADDDVIGVAWARATIAAFTADGAVAELREFPGVGHRLTPEMLAELTARVRAALDAAP
jgi:phospholipase/carboxylesterase